METLLVIISTLAIYLLIGWLWMMQNDRRLLAKQKKRTPLPKEAFKEIYIMQGYIKSVVQDLYNEVKSYVPKHFNLDPGDDLSEDYKIDEGDLEELAIKYFKTVRNREPLSEDFRIFNLENKALYTFEGLLAFVHPSV